MNLTDDALWELVCRAWASNPEERPTAIDMLHTLNPELKAMLQGASASGGGRDTRNAPALEGHYEFLKSDSAEDGAYLDAVELSNDAPHVYHLADRTPRDEKTNYVTSVDLTGPAVPRGSQINSLSSNQGQYSTPIISQRIELEEIPETSD